MVEVEVMLVEELAIEVMKRFGTRDKISTSAIQRYLGVSYGRASDVMEYLEKAGKVGPRNSIKERDIIHE